MEKVYDPVFLVEAMIPTVVVTVHILLDLGPVEGQYTKQVDPSSGVLILGSTTAVDSKSGETRFLHASRKLVCWLAG
jgi:hypothetical protein